MSRSGYTDDDGDDMWAHIRWRGAVKSAIRGKRGQSFLREMLANLDAMPVKELVAYDIVRTDGACCALGCVAKARGVEVSDLNPVDHDDDNQESTEALAARLGIPPTLAREIVYLNDEACDWRDEGPTTDAKRWGIVRQWVASQLLDVRP